MTALVKLRLGNMFDGPSDLIVLPCSTDGMVTTFVLQALENYQIASPKFRYDLGETELRPFQGGESIAQFVAFAASVYHHSSTREAIYSIGVQLGAYTQQEESIRSIMAPLLGAGAGGLRSEIVVKSLSDGFKSKALYVCTF